MPRKPIVEAPGSTHVVDDVEDLLDALNDENDVVVLQRTNVNPPLYLGVFDPTMFRALGIRETVREKFGGGVFSARLRTRAGKWGVSRRFAIEGEPITAKPSPAAADERDRRSVGERPTRENPWEKIFVPIAGTIASAVGAWAAKKMLEDPKPDPIVLELLKQATGGKSPDPLALQTAIAEAEKRGEDRGREMGSMRAQLEAKQDGGASGGVVGAIERNLPDLLKTVNRKLDLDERVAVRARLATSSTPAGDDAATEQPDETGEADVLLDTPPADPLEALLLDVPKVARQFLLAAAEGDEHPQIYAGLVASKLDQSKFAQLPALLGRGDFIDTFVRVYPAFEPYREWVRELAAALRDIVEATNKADAQDSAASA